MKTKIIFTILVCLSLSTLVHAQVTIGSDSNPDASAILDLKNNPDDTSTKGLLFPRVAIADTAIFGLEGNSLTEGMVVYNTTANSKNYGKGLYYWSGSKWVYMKSTDSPAEWVLGGNLNGSVRTLGTRDNFDLPFITNNVERMRATATGNVGVGTNAPTARFSVSGGPLAQDDFTAGDKFLLLRYPNSAKMSVTPDTAFAFYAGSLVQSNGVSPQNANTGQFLWNVADVSNSWRELMRLTNSGNLGIGTANPGAKLDVNGTTILNSQLVLQSLPVSSPTDKVLTIDNNNIVHKSAVSVPQFYESQVTVTAAATGTTAVTNLGNFRTLSVTTVNTCGDVAVASFNIVAGILSYLGGSAKDVNYTVTTLNPGIKVRLVASVAACAPGGTDQFNMEIEYISNSIRITNLGTTELVYRITYVEY